MGAIIGIYHFTEEPVSQSHLQGMMEAMPYRGLDGGKAWQSGSVGLGYMHRHITPESALEMMPTEHEGFVVIANNRLDNRSHLLQTLDLPTDAPESALLLSAYQKWGRDCPEYLRGAFAFCIYDTNRAELFCARDHFGLRNFYYYWSPDLFAFASEMKALFTLSGVPKVINENRIADFVLWQYYRDEINTFYQNVFRLPPGHSMMITPGQRWERQYWKLTPQEPLQLGDDAAYAEAFRERFDAAVKDRLRTEFPIGTHISGGLDSSSVALVAAQHVTEPLYSYSLLAPDVPSADEHTFINEVISAGSFQAHYFRADNISPLRDLDAMLHVLEEPSNMVPSAYMIWHTNQMAQEHGRRVMLTGMQGDMTVGHGFGYLTTLAYQQEWDMLDQQIEGLAQNLPGFESDAATPIYFHNGVAALREYLQERRWGDVWQMVNKIAEKTTYSRWDIIRGQVLGPQLYRLLGRDPNPPGEIALPPTEDFAKKFDLYDKHRQYHHRYLQPAMSEQVNHVQDFNKGLLVNNLEFMNLLSAPFGLEVWHPFFDKELVEFCSRLPGEQKLRDGWSRYVLRQSMTDTLPPKVQWRNNKADVGMSVHHALRTFDENAIKSFLTNKGNLINTYVDLSKMRHQYENAVATHHNKRIIDSMTQIWNAMMLGAWLSSH